jgi:ABC-type Fe3+-hydroxamate transport system substrate-binding protein
VIPAPPVAPGAPVTAPRRSVTDDLGTVSSLPAEPRRIVSLVPNLSEVLWWWHLADRVVGVTDWCVAPPHAFTAAERVRGTKNPDLRRIVGLSPDVVIADQEENRELDVRRLREAGVAVYVTRARSVREAADALSRLAAALGRPSAGTGLRQAILRAAQQVRAPSAPVRVACPIWRDGAARGAEERWWLAGPDTFLGDLLATCGFANVVTDPAARYPQQQLQELLAAGPDVVLLPDEPFAFGPQDATVFRDRGIRVRALDGTAAIWWGPRTPHAIGDLSRLARQLTRRRAGTAAQ